MDRRLLQKIARLAAQYRDEDDPCEARKISSQIFGYVHKHSSGHRGMTGDRKPSAEERHE